MFSPNYFLGVLLLTSHIYLILKTSFSCLKMTQKMAILAKIGHFSGIGDTKTSKYPLIVNSSACKSTFKEPIYLCLRNIMLRAELPTIKGNKLSWAGPHSSFPLILKTMLSFKISQSGSQNFVCPTKRLGPKEILV